MLALIGPFRLVGTEDLMVLVLLTLPVFAVLGGIAVGIVRAVGQQRQLELARRERIAALERGLDPSSVPPLPPAAGGDYFAHGFGSPAEHARRRYQGLLIAAILSVAIGIGMMLLFSIVEEHGKSWAIGILPLTLGAGLLLSAWLVRPRDDGQRPRT